MKTLNELEKQVVTPQGGKSSVKKYFTVSAGESYRIRFRQEMTEAPLRIMTMSLVLQLMCRLLHRQLIGSGGLPLLPV